MRYSWKNGAALIFPLAVIFLSACGSSSSSTSNTSSTNSESPIVILANESNATYLNKLPTKTHTDYDLPENLYLPFEITNETNSTNGTLSVVLVNSTNAKVQKSYNASLKLGVALIKPVYSYSYNSSSHDISNLFLKYIAVIDNSTLFKINLLNATETRVSSLNNVTSFASEQSNFGAFPVDVYNEVNGKTPKVSVRTSPPTSTSLPGYGIVPLNMTGTQKPYLSNLVIKRLAMFANRTLAGAVVNDIFSETFFCRVSEAGKINNCTTLFPDNGTLTLEAVRNQFMTADSLNQQLIYPFQVTHIVTNGTLLNGTVTTYYSCSYYSFDPKTGSKTFIFTMNDTTSQSGNFAFLNGTIYAFNASKYDNATGLFYSGKIERYKLKDAGSNKTPEISLNLPSVWMSSVMISSSTGFDTAVHYYSFGAGGYESIAVNGSSSPKYTIAVGTPIGFSRRRFWYSVNRTFGWINLSNSLIESYKGVYTGFVAKTNYTVDNKTSALDYASGYLVFYNSTGRELIFIKPDLSYRFTMQLPVNATGVSIGTVFGNKFLAVYANTTKVGVLLINISNGTVVKVKDFDRNGTLISTPSGAISSTL